MEKEKSLDEQLMEKAEEEFASAVAATIASNPAAFTKPLKYRPGTFVWAETAPGEKFRILKARAGMYLLKAESGKVATSPEDNLLPFN